jgi:transcriptional regulator with XRE-family HTH domain
MFVKNRVVKKKKRYKNQNFLTALGWQCRTLRVMKGFSVDRLVRESDQLSGGTIDRLERGMADVQITVLLRYAKALELSLPELLDFLEAR